MGEPAISFRFDVEVGGIQVGTFSKVEGLNVRYETLDVKEGGLNGFTHRLRGRVEYDPLRLTRPLDGDSKPVMDWFGKLADDQHSPQRSDATISAYDGNGQLVASWTLFGVRPVKYTGPSLDLSGSSVMTETIELSHEGFLSQPLETEVTPSPQRRVN